MDTSSNQIRKTKKIFSIEPFVFTFFLLFFFYLFARKMGVSNTLNTIMNTAFDLLINVVLYIMAICVITGAFSGLLKEFGIVSILDIILQPLMHPVWGLPGAASLGIITTFLSDNPAILTLAADDYYKHYYKRYQFPALTNLGTSFGMGLIVCTFMLSLSLPNGDTLQVPVLIGLLGAVVGSILSTRLMLFFSKKFYLESAEDTMGSKSYSELKNDRPVRTGSVGTRFIEAMLDGGKSGVDMGLAIIPGVLIICTFVMMLTYGAGENGYSGAAYQGIGLLPVIAEKMNFILKPIFGFTSAECIVVPITALGAAGAALGIVPNLLASGAAAANDIAVFTAMCMCWSGYLSTHVSMMSSIGCEKLISKAILSHTIGGLLAGAVANFAYKLLV